VTRTLERASARVAEGGARLDALSPLRVLARGYAVARDASGTVLRSVVQFPPGLAFRLRVRDGEIAARVGES
jgi:exodeoxyribonuclease VII large subunit